VHRDAALSKSAALGALLQLAVAGIVHLVPALKDAGWLSVGGTLIGGFAGLRYGRRSAGIPLVNALARAAWAGAVGGVLGAVASSLLGDAPLNAVLIAGMSTLLAGIVGGGLGRLLPGARAA
jgi:hypothetical protein